MLRKAEEKAKEKEEKAEEAEDSSAERKAEAMLQKSNKKLGKHGPFRRPKETRETGRSYDSAGLSGRTIQEKWRRGYCTGTTGDKEAHSKSWKVYGKQHTSAVQEEPECVQRPVPPEGGEDEEDDVRGIEKFFEPFEHEEAADLNLGGLHCHSRVKRVSLASPAF